MIVSVSRRTDVPRHYPDEFRERLDAGYCLVRNPFNANQVTRVSLRKADVDCFVFWTRFPAPFLPVLELLEDRGYPSVMFMTITGYPEILEPGAPRFEEAIVSFKAVSRLLGKNRISLRFDPIMRTEGISLDLIGAQFETIARELSGYTGHAVVSLYDSYTSSETALAKAGVRALPIDIDDAATGDFLSGIAETARGAGMTASACAEGHDLSRFGIDASPCIDPVRINRALGLSLAAKRDKSQRPFCRCAVSKDIGAYRTCPSGCRYCYAGTFRHSHARADGFIT